MIKKIFFHLKTLNKYRKFKDFIKFHIDSDIIKNKNKKNIILFEFIDMCSTHIAYLNIIQPLTKIYNSTPYAISTGLSSKKKIIFYKLIDFLNLFHFGVFNTLNIKKKIFLTKYKKKHQGIYFPNKKKDFMNFKYKNVVVGDLIYDSYLRYNFKSTLNLNDKKFKVFFYESLDYFDEVIKIFKKYNIKAVFLSHTVYLPAFIGRLALINKADFYCVGITHLIKLSKNNYHIHNHKNYKKTFNKIPTIKKKQFLNITKNEISKLLNGEKNFNMVGLSRSPFKKKTDKDLIKKSKKIKILVATQCLIDSPHAFGNWFFSDFVEWLEYLGKISLKTDYEWYIKPHPNNLRRNKDFIDQYLIKYPKFKLIPSETSHYTLKNKVDFVLTNWGNIGMDLALLNIKVLNTHPNGRFSAFKFNINSNTFNEYNTKILNLKRYKKFKINKKEIYESYFMHNFYYGPNWLIDNLVKEMTQLGWDKKDGIDIYDYYIKKFNKNNFKKKQIKLTNNLLKIKLNKEYSKYSPLKNY